MVNNTVKKCQFTTDNNLCLICFNCLIPTHLLFLDINNSGGIKLDCFSLWTISTSQWARKMLITCSGCISHDNYSHISLSKAIKFILVQVLDYSVYKVLTTTSMESTRWFDCWPAKNKYINLTTTTKMFKNEFFLLYDTHTSTGVVHC